VGHFPASENGMLESEGIQKFKDEKIFEIASERCVTIETETPWEREGNFWSLVYSEEGAK